MPQLKMKVGRFAGKLSPPLSEDAARRLVAKGYGEHLSGWAEDPDGAVEPSPPPGPIDDTVPDTDLDEPDHPPDLPLESASRDEPPDFHLRNAGRYDTTEE